MKITRKRVTLSKKDAQAILDFARHFKIPVHVGLSDAIAAFIGYPCLEMQELVKVEMCIWIQNEHKNAELEDEMYDESRRKALKYLRKQIM